jgi:hypothetical protein
LLHPISLISTGEYILSNLPSFLSQKFDLSF